MIKKEKMIKKQKTEIIFVMTTRLLDILELFSFNDKIEILEKCINQIKAEENEK